MKDRKSATAKRHLYRLLAALVLLCPAPAFADGLSQADAQAKAEKLNNLGSNDSMEAATGSAMNAMMNLAALNIGGAVSNGYKAYGQYINSEKLDTLEARTKNLKNSMNSVAFSGATSSSGSSGTGVNGTSFSRLDPGFLRKGKIAEIADAFEKQSGMKREDFLKHLASATDSELTYGDPSLQQKLEARFNNFTNSIPNKEFRAGLENAAALLPNAARGEILNKLATQYADAWNGENPVANIAANDGNGDAASPAAPVTANGEKSADAESARGLASSSSAANASGDKGEKSSNFLGLGAGSQDALKDLLSSANASPDNETLFLKVSKRYRLLTPLLVSRRPLR